MHKWVSEIGQVIIGSGNGLLPDTQQFIVNMGQGGT